MREVTFKVEFLSDIILNATSNTEGKIEQLDFIPGSAFLGMVAQEYDSFENSFDIFHSGKVRFGDATILKGDLPTYKIPLSFFHKKLEAEKIYNHHLLNESDFKTLGQLKQLRSGYITKDKEQIFIEYVYSQKSAYDKINRRSKDASMYGYRAVKKGTNWQFAIKLDDTISKRDEEKIIEILLKSKRLGKSKSAEYGDIKIKKIDSKVETIEEAHKGDEVILYAKSRLILVDDFGNQTLDLKYICKNLKDENIVYEKTQIRVSSFTPYNQKRETKDYERVCVNKGSVIVLKNISNEQLQQIKNGVGAFLAEGFGEILINPNFLIDNGFSLIKDNQKTEKYNERVKITKPFSNKIVQFLANKHNAAIDMLEIANEVASFVQEHKKSTFKNIKNSQWGNVRSLTSCDDFIHKIESYISDGTKKWEQNQINVLMESVNNHKIDKQKFAKLLAMKMVSTGGKND